MLSAVILEVCVNALLMTHARRTIYLWNQHLASHSLVSDYKTHLERRRKWRPWQNLYNEGEISVEEEHDRGSVDFEWRPEQCDLAIRSDEVFVDENG